MFSFLLKETSCGSILVRDHLPLATTPLRLRILGGLFREVRLRVVPFSSSSVASVGTCFGSWISRIDLHTTALLHYILKSTNIILYLKENASWQVVQLRDDLKEEVFAGKMFRIVSDSFRGRETAGPYELRSLSSFLGPLVAA